MLRLGPNRGTPTVYPCKFQQVANGVSHRFEKKSLSLDFMHPSMRVNWQYCRNVLLSQQTLRVIKSLAGDTFIFQQNSALDIVRRLSCCSAKPQLHRCCRSSFFSGVMLTDIQTSLT